MKKNKIRVSSFQQLEHRGDNLIEYVKDFPGETGFYELSCTFGICQLQKIMIMSSSISVLTFVFVAAQEKQAEENILVDIACFHSVLWAHRERERALTYGT